MPPLLSISILCTAVAIFFFILWVMAIRKLDRTEEALSRERFGRAVAETQSREWEGKYEELKENM